MNIWKKYTSIIRKNILTSCEENKDLKYWQDDIFTNTIIYILPLSIIALVPSLIWTIKSEHYIITLVDLISISIVLFIGFKKGIKIATRKLIFLVTLYILSSVLVYYVGLNSTLYLLAACFLATFMYDHKNQYTPAFFNVYICIFYTVLFYFDLTPSYIVNFTSGELIAVFANLIFLSFLICSLIPRLFKGLDENFKNSIQHTQKIEKQNEVLKEITWIQSHVVRTPLTRLMAITNLLKENNNTDEEKKFLMDNIIISTKELDDIIKEIVSKSEKIRSLDK